MRGTALILLLALVSCGTQRAPEVPQMQAQAAIPVRAAPPEAAPGTCWGLDSTPARIETVTERIPVAREVVRPDGTLVPEEAWRVERRQEIVEDRRDMWFQTPCESDLTADVVASLQRALAARGLYAGPASGEMTAETRAAIRRFQAPLGLDSSVLSLDAARRLGLALAATGA